MSLSRYKIKAQVPNGVRSMKIQVPNGVRSWKVRMPSLLGAEFDGSSYVGQLDVGDSGLDSTRGTVSLWVKFTSPGAVERVIYNLGGRVDINKGTDNLWRIIGFNNVGVKNLEVRSVHPLVEGVWNHLLASWDIDAGLVHLYSNDVQSEDIRVLTSGVVDYSRTAWTVGATNEGTSPLIGALCAVYYDFGNYYDFSVEAERRKFINGDGGYVDLGEYGRNPSGVSPSIFLNNKAGSFWFNRGSVGDFTSVGELTPANIAPPSKTTVINGQTISGTPQVFVGSGQLEIIDSTFENASGETLLTFNAHPRMQGIVKDVITRNALQGVGINNGDYNYQLQFLRIDSSNMEAGEDHFDLFGSHRVILDTCTADIGTNGFKMGGTGSQGNKAIDCDASNMTNYGFGSNGAVGTEFIRCTASDCGIGFVAADNAYLRNCTATLNLTTGLRVQNNSVVYVFDSNFSSTVVDTGCTLYAENCNLGATSGGGTIIET